MQDSSEYIYSSILGLTLARLPSTFYLPISTDWIPRAVLVKILSTSHMPLCQKLCDDNRIDPVRVGTQATVQHYALCLHYT